MKVIQFLTLLCIALMLGDGSQATTRGSFFVPDLPVNPVSSSSFEIITNNATGNKNVWCAAAYHAVFALGFSRGRLYIERPVGAALYDPSKLGVVFSTEVSGAAKVSSTAVDVAGNNLLINHALQFCRDSDLEADL